MRWLIPFALLAVPAAAQEAMTADEFDAYVTGKTLTYSDGGPPYGIEEYRPGREVSWRFVDDEVALGGAYRYAVQALFTGGRESKMDDDDAVGLEVGL